MFVHLVNAQSKKIFAFRELALDKQGKSAFSAVTVFAFLSTVHAHERIAHLLVVLLVGLAWRYAFGDTIMGTSVGVVFELEQDLRRPDSLIAVVLFLIEIVITNIMS